MRHKILFSLLTATALLMSTPLISSGIDFENYFEALPETQYSEGNSTSEKVEFSGDNYESDAYYGNDSASYQLYTVKKGDTLGGISNKFYGTTKHWKRIATANGINNPSSLKIGRELRIPGAGRPEGSGYTIRERENYYFRNPASGQSVSSSPSLPELPLPPASDNRDMVLYSDQGLPQIYLPGTMRRDQGERNSVTMNGLTGLINTFAAYPLGKGLFSTAIGFAWNKITQRDGERLQSGEDADYWAFPLALTYSAENFEVAMQIPFESYDVFAPLTYNFRDGTDSGMGDVSLRLKFSSQNENMASCLGIGAIFPTSDRMIGNSESDNAWEAFAGISTRKREGGNFHLNAGYQAGDGNTDHEGIFFNVGFDYAANSSFTFIGEINSYNRVNNGRSTDLTLGLKYFVKPGMTLSAAAPIALSNDMFFGYDYRLLGQLQYNY